MSESSSHWGTRQYHMAVNLKQIPTCTTETKTSVTLSKQSEWVAGFNLSIVQPANTSNDQLKLFSYAGFCTFTKLIHVHG